MQPRGPRVITSARGSSPRRPYPYPPLPPPSPPPPKAPSCPAVAWWTRCALQVARRESLPCPSSVHLPLSCPSPSWGVSR
eukprot:6197690-Pyramimonas_sp.AAC.1